MKRLVLFIFGIYVFYNDVFAASTAKKTKYVSQESMSACFERYGMNKKSLKKFTKELYKIKLYLNLVISQF